jgi:hypothetical protein
LTRMHWYIRLSRKVLTSMILITGNSNYYWLYSLCSDIAAMNELTTSCIIRMPMPMMILQIAMTLLKLRT